MNAREVRSVRATFASREHVMCFDILRAQTVLEGGGGGGGLAIKIAIHTSGPTNAPLHNSRSALSGRRNHKCTERVFIYDMV